MAASIVRRRARPELPLMKTNGSLDRVPDSDMDSRRMCFEQGKAFVYMPDEDGDVIIAEEPNGVVEHRRISDGTVTNDS